MNEVSDAAPDSEIEDVGAQMRSLKEQKVELKQGKTLKQQQNSSAKKEEAAADDEELNSFRDSERSGALEEDF